ncbi:MAG: head GIN domain-containing protein [Bacteroidia bacterium]|nr:head GIN domain-containing protein [Bacteroidia bacterium]
MKTWLIWAIMLTMSGPLAAQALRGNGNVVMTERRMGDFSGLVVDGIFDVFITLGEKNHLTLEADENLHEAVITKIEGGKLYISQRTPFKNVSKLVVYVAMNHLDYLRVSGAVDVESNATFTGASLHLVAGGAGDIELQVKVDELITEVIGAANIVLHGQAAKTRMAVTGSGDLDASQVQVGTADIRVDGSGDVYVQVKDMIKAHVSGAGSVYCKGNPPQREVTERGVGSVEFSE